MESRAVDDEVPGYATDGDTRHENRCQPTEASLPRHSRTFMWISKSLPQSDIELGSFHSRNRVEVSSDIKAHRTHRGVVP